MHMPIPADVPHDKKETFQRNMRTITRATGRLALFSADQKIEHLNSVSPKTLFNITHESAMGAFATHLGLIHRYANMYPHINYIVKANAKTNIYDTTYDDPYSTALCTVDQITKTQEHIDGYIRGIGYTVYLGSMYEAQMLHEAAQMIYAAHQHGLVAIIWMYPRGLAISNETDPDIIRGASSVATSIGADFVKVKPPAGSNQESASHLSSVSTAAGNTGVICSGGPKQETYQFLTTVYEQIHTGMTAGCAVGRNIFERDIQSAIALTQAISAIVYDNVDTKKAYYMINT